MLCACSRNLEGDLDLLADGVVYEYEYKDPEHIVFRTKNRDLKAVLLDSTLILSDFKTKYTDEYEKISEITIQAVTNLENMAGASLEDEPILEITWQRRHLDSIDFNRKPIEKLEQVIEKIDQVQSYNLAGDLVLSDHCMAIMTNTLDESFCEYALRGLYNQ